MLAGRGNYHSEQRYKTDHVYVEKKAMRKMRGTKKVMGMRKAKKGIGKRKKRETRLLKDQRDEGDERDEGDKEDKGKDVVASSSLQIKGRAVFESAISGRLVSLAIRLLNFFYFMSILGYLRPR